FLEASQSNDVACEGFFDVFTAVGVHLQHTADTLTLTLDGVFERNALGQLARIDAGESQRTNERVVHDLERKHRKRCFIRRFTGGFSFRLDINALDGRHVGRSRKEFHNSVEKRLNATVLERGTAKNRMELDVDGALTDQSAQLVIRRHGAFEIGFHCSFVDFHGQLDELFAVFFSLVLQMGRNFTNRRSSADGAVPGQGLHFDQVDDAFELVFSADRQLNRECYCAKTRTDHFYATVEIGTDLVHLVDEDHTRDVVLFSLTPHGFGLGLNASVGVEQRDCAVENAQAALNFNREVNVTRRVDDVETALLTITALPERGRSSGSDRDTAFLFLLHPVHGRRT